MSSVNIHGITPKMVLKTVKGLQETRPGLLDMLFPLTKTTQLSGKGLAFSSVNQLPRVGQGGIAPGAERKTLHIEPTEFQFDCLRYGGDSLIPDQRKIDLDSYEGMNTLQHFVWLAMQVCRAEKNQLLQSKLEDTNLNETDGVSNGAWSVDTSTPFDDFDAAFNKIGDADLVIYGRDIRQKLQKHPDFIAEAKNFAAGVVNGDTVSAVIKSVYSHVKKVVSADQMYNTAGEGLPYNLGWQFNGLVWVGYAEGVQYVKQTGNVETEIGRDVKKRSTLISHEEVIDVQRVIKELGYLVTGA